ncbi:MAG: excinuclease ABC subunit C [bacterium]|jgi:excinuclease ABC subunit C
MKLEEKLKLLPEQSGVYLHKNGNDSILYIGKAKSLKNRVRSYFHKTHSDPRIAELVSQIRNTDWIVTNTEVEALILEDHLIKTHKPKFNVRLRDDKTYPYIKLSVQELFPRLILTREIDTDGALYFGPYVNVFAARSTLKIIRKYFPLRQKNLPLNGVKIYRPCLNFQLKRCFAPCAGKITPEKYQEIVKNIQSLLKGNFDELIAKLQKEMEEKSIQLEFEEAGMIRDQINAVRNTLKKQQVVSKGKVNRDVFSIVRYAGLAGVQVMFIRNGSLLSGDFFFFQKGESFSDEELLRSVISKLYLSNNLFIPDEIVFSVETEAMEMLEEYFQEKRQKRVKTFVGLRGEKKSQLEIAQKNGEQNLALKKAGHLQTKSILEEVQQNLRLQHIPYRVECFDISNLSGTDTVASMVVWENHKPKKSDYKRYKIKTVEGSNDFASMEEVLTRRYKRALTGELPLPNLIIIDGGKGQLQISVNVLQKLEIDFNQFDLVGLAKGRSEKRAGVIKKTDDYEYIVKPNQKNEIRLKKNSNTLHFLQNIRDEAHRFAITYHRTVRKKRLFQSQLDQIPGIGSKKKKILLSSLKSIEGIASSSKENLSKLKGITKQDADAIVYFFKTQEE